MDLLGIGIVIPLVLAGILVSVTYSLLNQSSRQVFAVIRRLDELESAIDGLVDAMPGAGSTHAEGIPIGEPAPDFSLPALTGSAPTVSLEDLRGKRLLLMFMRPGCTYCQQMAPDVAEMPIDGRGGRPVPVILTIGEEAENREFVDEFDLKGPVLRHADDALYRPYKITGTPMGYLIDEQGNIASDVLVGGDAILATYESTIVPENGSAQTENGTNGAGLKTTQSRLQRDGLKAGTVAPDFSLPAIDGSTLHLADLRGRPVLLVFSDPECAPCQALAPHLEKLHRKDDDPRVVMVSRGDLAANQAKADEHGLTFPIAMQRHWEVSRAYAMFKTPIGYLVDPNGVIAEDVAVGGDAVLALARGAAARAGGQREVVVTRE